MLEEDLAAALDPCALARKVGLVPDPWQAQLLRSTNPRQLVLCSRQSGKSTMAAIAAAHTAIYTPGSLTLLVSPSERQSGENFKKVTSIMNQASWPVPARQQTALTLTLQNGSRVVALPGSETTVRGYSAVSLLILDEAARIEPELIVATRPMLSVSGGSLLALSTPNGALGWFWEAWVSREPYERFKVKATQCPRISADFLESEKRALGFWIWSQEYQCEFVNAESQAFDSEAIRRAIRPDIRPLNALSSAWV